MVVKQNLTTEKKVNMIFSYLFSYDKSKEEEFFWNRLNDKEVSELKKIEQEKTYDFNILKEKVIWK